MAFIYNLPEEIVLKIFTYLSFYTLQKKCTLVSKAWLTIIRNSSKFSSKIFLKLDYERRLPLNLIENCLDRWPKLETLYLNQMNPTMVLNLSKENDSHIDFDKWPNIKIVILKGLFPIKGCATKFKAISQKIEPQKIHCLQSMSFDYDKGKLF